jgi:hypothetical protein
MQQRVRCTLLVCFGMRKTDGDATRENVEFRKTCNHSCRALYLCPFWPAAVVSLVYIKRIILIREYLFTIKADRKTREETPAHLQVDRETNSWTRKTGWGARLNSKRVQSKNERLV